MLVLFIFVRQDDKRGTPHSSRGAKLLWQPLFNNSETDSTFSVP